MSFMVLLSGGVFRACWGKGEIMSIAGKRRRRRSGHGWTRWTSLIAFPGCACGNAPSPQRGEGGRGMGFRSVPLPQRDVQRHHERETDHGEGGRDVGAGFAALGLGDEFLDDDVDHGARGEGQGIGQDGRMRSRRRRPARRRPARPCRRACHTRRPCAGSCPSRRRGMATAMPSGKFWRPMPMPARRPRRAVAEEIPADSRAKRDAHREPFGDVVQGDGQHQERRCAASAS